MDLQNRIDILADLGDYMLGDERGWLAAKDRAFRVNAWFTPEFTDLAIRNIVHAYLQPAKLLPWTAGYIFKEQPPKNVGLVMAGNIPLVGFHDFLCVFISGHAQTIRPSSKDKILIEHIVHWLHDHYPETRTLIRFAEMLKGCDAYIATGSNNSSRYFEYYFGKYPNCIRRNRSSVAILTGAETAGDLALLASDVYLYFGLGCRNVTKILVPKDYDFLPLLDAFRVFDRLADHNKYKNNYDYQLTLLILNKQYYMSNDSILLRENASVFSPISVLHYGFYDNAGTLPVPEPADDIQCIVGAGGLPFGSTQQPRLADFADGIDTLRFLLSL